MLSVLIGQDRSVLVSCQAVRLAVQCATAVAGCCGVLPVHRGTWRCLGSAQSAVKGVMVGGLASTSCRLIANKALAGAGKFSASPASSDEARLAVLAAAGNLMHVLHCCRARSCRQAPCRALLVASSAAGKA